VYHLLMATSMSYHKAQIIS